MRLLVITLLLAIVVPLAKADRSIMVPADSLPTRWEYYPSAEGQMISLDDTWWKNFDDPVLDELIETALKNNYDLRTAFNNINIALNTYRATRSGYFPTLSATAGWEKDRISGLMYGGGSATKRQYWTGQLGISWQVDLFGKITKQLEAKKASYQATQAEWAATMLTVVSEVIKEYIDLRVAQKQLELMQQHAESQLDIVEMVLARQEAGVASMLDVAQAKTVYYSTLANIPGYENTITSCLNALAVLTGTYTYNLPDELRATPQELPKYQQLVSIGIPLDLLRRRPDIIEMEKTVASYAAQLGVAKKDFLPSLTIEGTISTVARDADKLFTRQSLGYTIAPTLTWNFPTGGELTYNVRVARETLDNEINNYNYTVINAVEEVNNAISSFRNAMMYIKSLDDVVIWARKSLSLSVDLYRNGLTAFSNVVDAQEDVLEYETEAVTARENALVALVQLYTSLGGGWQQEE